MMNRTRHVAGMIAVLLLSPLGPLHATGAAAPVRPNILFIMVDDLGWRDLGCFGSRFHQTPNLDRLAAQAERMRQAFP